MYGKAPGGIITDQDRAMQNAIEIVFPNTRHRWCLWHILKKLPEKFSYHGEKGSILHAIHELVYDTLSCKDFKEGWMNMVEHFELQDYVWSTGIYKERSCWLFVEQYERALKSKVEKEFVADFRSFSQMVPCAMKYDMEKQFQGVYIITKFREFQQEVTGKVYCDVLSAEEFNGVTKYEVHEDIIVEEGKKKKTFTVCYRGDNCCHLFEFRGIICKHAISVLIRNDVSTLPERYVLRRWRRDVCRPYVWVTTMYDGLVSTADQLRYEQLCVAFTKMADMVAKNEEQSKHLLGWIEFQTSELAKSKCNIIGVHGNELSNVNGPNILDPNCTKSKGAPKKLRKKSFLEGSSKKSKGCKKSTVSRTYNRLEVNIAKTVDVEDLEVCNISSSQAPQTVGTQDSVELLFIKFFAGNILESQNESNSNGINWVKLLSTDSESFPYSCHHKVSFGCKADLTLAIFMSSFGHS
ncbi:protein FAR1-RELATED SEQUENCE 1-like [Olea europaea var. sylvestris]|uniref:protein FAR1-RELATED SEQUENCE 1-like n=1 Tax=Olea europaea var. sylvestris TaxID=158386 RepID=UPI000C1D8364|nr:protein FAR1-RELATED SEQUENCE 1-like [Olea europaea var. sylvestris]